MKTVTITKHETNCKGGLLSDKENDMLAPILATGNCTASEVEFIMSLRERYMCGTFINGNTKDKLYKLYYETKPNC